MLKTRLKLKPGQRGTKKLVQKYGEQLVCVRYRYDEERRQRLKTVELVEEAVAWIPAPGPPAADVLMEVKVAWGEVELAREIKQAGGNWNRARKVWLLRYEQVVELGLQERAVGLAR